MPERWAGPSDISSPILELLLLSKQLDLGTPKLSRGISQFTISIEGQEVERPETGVAERCEQALIRLQVNWIREGRSTIRSCLAKSR